MSTMPQRIVKNTLCITGAGAEIPQPELFSECEFACIIYYATSENVCDSAHNKPTTISLYCIDRTLQPKDRAVFSSWSE